MIKNEAQELLQGGRVVIICDSFVCEARPRLVGRVGESELATYIYICAVYIEVCSIWCRSATMSKYDSNCSEKLGPSGRRAVDDVKRSVRRSDQTVRREGRICPRVRKFLARAWNLSYTCIPI